MTLQLRIVLIAVSLLILIFVLYKVRRSDLNIPETFFWIFFAGLLLVLSIFPQIAYFLSGLLGFDAPINFLILLFIALIFIKLFLVTLRQSELREKLNELARHIAIEEFKRRRKDE